MAMSPYLTTPFHDRIAPLCETDSWQRWEGYTTVATVTALDEEYFAIRNAATLFDTSPLRNYRVAGAHAERFVDRLITRDITRCAVVQVYYSGWCDDAGKLIEDGTIMRLGADEFQINAQEANLRWFEDTAYGLDVTIEEITEDVASLALQGPLSMTLLQDLGLAGIDALAPFRIALFELDGARLMVSRTGFTGDLGYELWIAPAHAGMLWDRLMAAGGSRPPIVIGSAALDLARIEAGFIQVNAEFISATRTLRASQTRSPYELGLDWTVNLGKDHFIGKRALVAEKARGGPRRRLVGLDIAGKKPAVESFLYAAKTEVGRTTSAIWSPVLKRNIALASVASAYAAEGIELKADIWHTKELKIERIMAPCRVVSRRFYDAPRRCRYTNDQ